LLEIRRYSFRFARNLMKKFIYFILFFPFFVSAQVKRVENELGFWLGGANYFGDLNNNTSFKGMGPAAGLYLRNNIGSRIAFKHGVSFGMVQFADRWSDNEFNLQRNLSFRSNIVELSSQFEFNFLSYVRQNVYKSQGKRWTPYFTIGISMFYYNPQARYNNTWYDLQPLGTEGQTETNYTQKSKYSLFSFAVPIGGGIKFNLNKYFSIGIEIANRKTFTDYLDDVSTTYTNALSLPDGDKGIAYRLADRSGEVGFANRPEGYQRGSSSKTDDFLMGGISISYTFWKMKCNFE
jgi:hypothetical protein